MMRTSPRASLAARAVVPAALALLALPACDRESSLPPASAPSAASVAPSEPAVSTSPTPTKSATKERSPEPKLPAAVSNAAYRPRIKPAEFTTDVDNAYYPLRPGTSYTFQGVSAGSPETDIVTVTHQTKVVMGVRCVVVRDEVRTSGALTELTFDWYAQDGDGNVWYFGEDSHEYSGGSPVSAFGSWQAGVDGAQPGIVMPGAPERGQRYRQEYRRGQAEDMAEILRLNDRAKVPYDTFKDVLVTRDFSPLEPGVIEQKYYATGVGVVQESLVQGGEEVSRLVRVRH